MGDVGDDERIQHRFKVKLFNGEAGEANMALACVDAPNAATWAKDEMGSIAGVRWEGDGSDFAYACIMNEPGLLAKLEAEGYLFDASEFVEAKAA